MSAAALLTRWDHAVVIGSWREADESALNWIMAASVHRGATGFAVTGFADTIAVLHRMYERVDGHPIPDSGGPFDIDSRWIDRLPSSYRVLTWRDYARRRGVELNNLDQWPFTYADDGILRERGVRPPEEGFICDTATWRAITTNLTAHSPEGSDTRCRAYYYDLLAFEPPDHQGAHVFRGRLGDSDDLIAPPQVGFSSPQNLWPDDHAWVLYTNYDAWYTQISGTPDLIRAIADNPELETIQLMR